MNTVIEFFMDPLRLTLIIAGVVVILAIIIFGRRSRKSNELRYSSSATKEFSFGSRLNEDAFTEEEVIVLPPKKKKTEVALNTEAFGPATTAKIVIDDNDELFNDPLNLSVEKNSESPVAIETNSTNSSEEKSANEGEVVSNKETTSKTQFVVLHIVATDEKLFSGADILAISHSLGLEFGKHDVFHYPGVSAETGLSKFCLVNMTSEGSFPLAELVNMEINGVSLIMRLPIANGDGLTVFSNMLGVAQAFARKLGGEILEQTRMPLTADIVTTLRSDIAHFESETKEQESTVPQL